MIFHCVAWIGVNASEEEHLKRMESLDDHRFIGLTTQMVYDEALANFFFDSHRYPEARIYYEDFMHIDSSNTRILANISDVYRKLNDKDNYFHILKRAAALNSTNPGVYSNLGVEYANRGDTDMAISYNEKAVAVDPTMAKAYANLGILYTARKNFVLADKNFQSAFALGLADKMLYHYAGNVCVYLKDYPRALKYFDAYLARDPNNEQIRFIRDKVFQTVQAMKEVRGGK
jgi:tetratricopeptide (TPR) repeat protein